MSTPTSAAPATILYVHSSDEMYGADKILLEIVENLPPARFRPLVVIPNDVPYAGQLTRALADRGIQTVHYPTAILRRKYFTPWGLLQYLWRLACSTWFLVRLIRREQVRLVHSNTAAVIPGALAARLTGAPHVWHVHEIITQPRFLWRFTSWLLPRLSARVVAVSAATRDHLCAGDPLNQSKAIVIHNGIDGAPYAHSEAAGAALRSEWSVSPDEVLAGMIGRVSHWKGQGYFVDVASHVTRQQPQARFALVGGVFPGQEQLIEELHAQVRGLGLEPVVRISDFRSDVPAVLQAYDIFVLPSTLPDPFPTVVLEAMASAKPVVAAAHGGSLEMVEDGVTGYLVPPNQPAQMAAAITRLCLDPTARKAMGDAGRARFHALFGLERFVAAWNTLYADLLAPPTPVPTPAIQELKPRP
jgi:glycosyltransferase involved in cell wall biosynthesis